jgi:hypothetical protein
LASWPTISSTTAEANDCPSCDGDRKASATNAWAPSSITARVCEKTAAPGSEIRLNARNLREYFERRPDVVDYFRGCLSPVEAVFQTIACSSGLFNLVPDCKRYFDFAGSRFNHPKSLTADDLPRALASGAHFARKFDYERNPELLDILDAHLAAEAARAAETANGTAPQR